MAGYKFNYETKVWGGEKIRVNPIYFRSVRLLYLLKEIKAPRKKKRLLDIGSGAGDFPEAIKHYLPNLDVYGVDISRKAINFAKKTYPNINFFVADAAKLPFRSGFFDYVSCFDVIEHVEDPDKTVREIGRILKKGGIFHTFIPTEGNIFSLQGALIKLGWKAKEVYGAHPHHFNIEKATGFIKNNGFKIKKVRYDEHVFKQLLEIVYFTVLSIKGKNLDYSVEGYIARVKPGVASFFLKSLKYSLSTIAFFEAVLFSWVPGLGVHITARKQ